MPAASATAPDSVSVTIIGAGYVGLVTGACLAAKGHRIRILDVKPDVIEAVGRGVSPIHESGLEPLIKEASATGCLQAARATVDAIGDAELVLLCVGTPSTGGAIDLTQVVAASHLAGGWLATRAGPRSVVVKSTVLPGTTDTVVRQAIEASSGRSLESGGFGLGMNPEFLREGEAVADFMAPDRIVLGHEDPATLQLLQRLYAPWSCAKLVVNSRTAEMIKYANNALLALQISAANELANIATRLGGIDFMDVLRGVSLDGRWSPVLANGVRVEPAILSYLVPGCGFGGSCFPKDVEALRTLARAKGLEPSILQAILDVNARQPAAVAQAIVNAFGGSVKGRTILLLGIAFKPGTDDVRESASLRIAAYLTEAGARLLTHDPVAVVGAADGALKDYETVIDWEPALSQVDAVIVSTKWPEYMRLRELVPALEGKVLFDARRMFHEQDFAGVRYLTVGGTEAVC